jgi:hypothetical protein
MSLVVALMLSCVDMRGKKLQKNIKTSKYASQNSFLYFLNHGLASIYYLTSTVSKAFLALSSFRCFNSEASPSVFYFWFVTTIIRVLCTC